MSMFTSDQLFLRNAMSRSIQFTSGWLLTVRDDVIFVWNQKLTLFISHTSSGFVGQVSKIYTDSFRTVFH